MVVSINAEISNYKEKVVGNYTLRQIVCLILAVMIGVTTYFYLDLPKDVKQFAVIIMALPIIAVGFYTYQGVTCEKYFYYMIREFLYPQKRPFIPEIEDSIVQEIKKKGGRSYDKKPSKHSKKRKTKKIQGAKDCPTDHTF